MAGGSVRKVPETPTSAVETTVRGCRTGKRAPLRGAAA
jgi:hypothetical protein